MIDEKFIKECQRNLIDLTARNSLINFKFNSPCCLDFDRVSDCLNKKNNNFEVIKVNEGLDFPDLTEYEKKLLEIHKLLGRIYTKQQEIIGEKGFNPTSWAYCFFKYKDNDKERLAPVYLISSEVKRDKAGGYCIDNFTDNQINVKFNYAIYEKFKKDFNIDLKVGFVDFEDCEFSIRQLDDKIEEIKQFLNRNGNLHKVLIEERKALSLFNSAKAALYNELVEFEEDFLQHDLVKVFLSKEYNELRLGEIATDPREIDQLLSHDFFSPFDFDSSQLQAIKAAKDGKNFILQGPPGTGKTQTISNIISELTAEGKKVLFVAEKKAAIDAVLKNFKKINLDKLFLDLHDKKTKLKDIVDKIKDSVDFFKLEKVNNIGENILLKLDESKNKINKRDYLLHTKLSFGKTLFDLLFELMQLEDIKSIDCNLFTKLSNDEFDKCLHLLEEIKTFSDVYQDLNNPFLQISLDKLQIFSEFDKNESTLFDFKQKIQDKERINADYSDLIEKQDKLIEYVGQHFFINLREFDQFGELKLFTENCQKLLNSKKLFEENNIWLSSEIKNYNSIEIANVLNVLKRNYNVKIENTVVFHELKLELAKLQSKGWYSKLLAKHKIKMQLSKVERNLQSLEEEIIKEINLIEENYFSFLDKEKFSSELDIRLNSIESISLAISAKKLKKEIDEKGKSLGINDLWKSIWQKSISIELFNKNIDSYLEIQDKLESVTIDLNKNWDCLKGLINTSLKYLDIEVDCSIETINHYLRYLPRLDLTLKYLELKNVAVEFSIDVFWEEFQKQKLFAHQIVNIFKKSFYLKVLDDLKFQDDLIFDSVKTAQIISDFKQLDKRSINLNRGRIIKRIRENKIAIIDQYDFKELINRKRGKLRKVIAKYREVIFNAVGCVVCSPLTICEYFEIDKAPLFDVVIFDEASQIYTWDSLSAIFRAKQLIIAGDSEQMPPSNLFISKDSEDDEFDEEEDSISMFEYRSLLSFASNKLRELSLQWHYRSRFEELIYPSNQFVYKGKLITFPSSYKNEKPITFHHLPMGIWEKQTNDVEAKYLISLLKQLYINGERSVGVIAFNQRQQILIKDLIDADLELRDWFDQNDENGLFVKNLENCQGDEREIILICSSYAKNKDGKIDGRMFSQINKADSYKRLNVMFSRAKIKIHFLSSLKWDEIPEHLVSGHKGMEFFKKYLRFAETGNFGIPLISDQNYDNFDSGFEESVCNSLRRLDYEVHSQVGCSGYRIDLAIVCPRSKNYILGIECDGEMYHSGRIARERDRLRQEILESKGWSIHRIWSYDWAYHRQEELGKIKSKINQLMMR